jgi:isocitrate dehydrogenase
VIPGSVLLSGVMMLEYMGWNEATRMIEKGMSAAINKGAVTYDFARPMKEEGRVDVKEIKWFEFGTEIIKNM